MNKGFFNLPSLSLLPKLWKFISEVERKQGIIKFAVLISFGIIILGFILLNFTGVEEFFSENQQLFYLIFFMPICLVILALLSLYFIAVFYLLHDEFCRMRLDFTPMTKIVFHICFLLLVSLILIAAIIYSGDIDFSKNKDMTSMSKRK